MRYLLFILVLSSFTAYAQKDPCRKVKRTVERSKGMTTYKSPEFKYATVIKQIKTDTFFAILFHFIDNYEHYDRYGATVEFTDGSKITDDNMAIKCTQDIAVFVSGASSVSSSSNGGRYVLQGFFRITNENIEMLCKKRIASITFHTARQAISQKDGLEIMKYVRCIKDRG